MGDLSEKLQEKVLTRWCNHVLKDRNIRIAPNTLFSGVLDDGLILWNLVEVLANVSLPNITKKANFRIQKLSNIETSINYLSQQRLQLSGVNSEVILARNITFILRLLWTILLRYQVPSGKENYTQHSMQVYILSWLNSIGVAASNLTQDFQNGMKIYQIFDAFKPGMIDAQSLRTQPPMDIIELVMTTSENELGFPRIVEPSDFTTETPHPMVTILYLSFYMKKFITTTVDAAIKKKLSENTTGISVSVVKTANSSPTNSHGDESKVKPVVRRSSTGTKPSAVVSSSSHPSGARVIGASNRDGVVGRSFIIPVVATKGQKKLYECRVKSQMTGDEIPNISFEEALTGYELKFTPTDAGVYLAEIKLTDAQIKGSPVTVNVMTEEQYHTRASNSLSGGVVPRASSDTTKVRDYTQSINANSLNNGNSMPARNSNGANSTSNPSMKTEVHTATTKQPVISYTLAPKTVTATTSHHVAVNVSVGSNKTAPKNHNVVHNDDSESSSEAERHSRSRSNTPNYHSVAQEPKEHAKNQQATQQPTNTTTSDTIVVAKVDDTVYPKRTYSRVISPTDPPILYVNHPSKYPFQLKDVDASEVDCTFTDPAGDRIVDDIDIEPIIDKKNSDSIIDRFNLVFTPSMKGRYTCLFKSPDGSEIGKLEIDVIVKTPKAKIVQLNGDGESWLIQCCFQEEF
eukprot:TRINITY_DN622_c0_g2_i1.p1 TRINITY_DN622_c0_g2~~TRINITY_DN622_c0_g2_i1.p1  ORF type:complete len:688 (-),score=167.86 TRINITY_DN622_c0_g2_i1:1193-3256(-)